MEVVLAMQIESTGTGAMRGVVGKGRDSTILPVTTRCCVGQLILTGIGVIVRLVSPVSALQVIQGTDTVSSRQLLNVYIFCGVYM